MRAACLGLLLLGVSAFAATEAAGQDRRPHVVLVIAEDEYETERTLPAFAARHLARDFRVTTVLGNPAERHDLPGLEAIDQADLLLVSVRRRAPTRPQLDAVRKFVAAGKPIVGIRTASHAFALRANEPTPTGHDVWPSFDPEVLGGHYTGHHREGPVTVLRAAPNTEGHPILAGIDLGRLAGKGSLYKVSPLAPTATPLLIGTIPGEAPEPIAWTNLRPDGGRTFYTSLGHKGDFEQPEFQRLLRNAIDWALAAKPAPSP